MDHNLLRIGKVLVRVVKVGSHRQESVVRPGDTCAKGRVSDPCYLLEKIWSLFGEKSELDNLEFFKVSSRLHGDV